MQQDRETQETTADPNACGRIMLERHIWSSQEHDRRNFRAPDSPCRVEDITQVYDRLEHWPVPAAILKRQIMRRGLWPVVEIRLVIFAYVGGRWQQYQQVYEWTREAWSDLPMRADFLRELQRSALAELAKPPKSETREDSPCSTTT
jgi:hypothetical protein